MRRISLLAAVGLIAACGQESRDPDITTTQADDGADEATGGSEEEGDEDGSDSGSDDGGDTGSSDDSGGPPACGDGPGCYSAGHFDARAGVASFVPEGCEGGVFEAAWYHNLGAIDAAKTTPVAWDLDGDGDLEIGFSARKVNTALVFPGNGDGTFGSAVNLAGGGFMGGWGMDLGDIDGDGMFDVAIGDHIAGAKVWKNGGSLFFQSSDEGLPVGGYSGGGLADLDADGDLDVVFGGDQFGGGFDVSFWDGDQWSAQAVAGLPPYGSPQAQNVGNFTFVDPDDDGDLDMFAFGQRNGRVWAFIYENGGDGATWTSRGTATGGQTVWTGGPVQGSVGDVDCDGRLDIATGGTIHLASDTWSWVPTATVDTSEVSHLADMNGDGFLDLVTQPATGGLNLYYGDGTGSGWVADTTSGLPDPSYYPETLQTENGFEFEDAWGIEIADVDSNGNLDIIRAYNLDDLGIPFDAGKRNIVEVWVR